MTKHSLSFVTLCAAAFGLSGCLESSAPVAPPSWTDSVEASPPGSAAPAFDPLNSGDDAGVDSGADAGTWECLPFTPYDAGPPWYLTCQCPYPGWYPVILGINAYPGGVADNGPVCCGYLPQ